MYLIFCTCGHALDRHGPEGCGGEGNLACRCLNDHEGALESAIERARIHPWGTPQPDLNQPELA